MNHRRRWPWQTGGPPSNPTTTRRRPATGDQPPPMKNEHPAVWDLVVADMNARDAHGQRFYGTRLQPHNGRDGIRDAYEEALDTAVYLKQATVERDGLLSEKAVNAWLGTNSRGPEADIVRRFAAHLREKMGVKP